MQTQKYDRHSDWDQRKKNQGDQISSKNVGIKTDGERHHARNVTDDLDRDHQWRQHRHRSCEVLRVSKNALLPDALPVVVEPRDHRQAERDSRSGSW
jgi:hypothetical protein